MEKLRPVSDYLIKISEAFYLLVSFMLDSV
jgi:hypothetical protein